MWRPSRQFGPVMGTVKFWKDDEGWGAISSPELPSGADAFAHFSVVEVEGYRSLVAGQPVEFTYRMQQQDSFTVVAEWVRPCDQGGTEGPG